jgi:hypothetical protein
MERSWWKSLLEVFKLMFSGNLLQEFKKEKEAQLELPLDCPE